YSCRVGLGVGREVRRFSPSSPCPGSRLAGRVPFGVFAGNCVLSRSLGVEGAGLGWSGVVWGVGLGLRLMMGEVMGESCDTPLVYRQRSEI
ncbi:hypothetical protein ACSYAD_32820, partial [Acaryochloris marina NIES-2412]|uniref:hypothetical protein n=1 Tax=Acaryochloris marina TaxID=155978 RepID=UPI004057D4D4